MRRNMELVYKILLHMEKNGWTGIHPSFKGHKAENIQEHFMLLINSGLIDHNYRMTWTGYDLLDELRVKFGGDGDQGDCDSAGDNDSGYGNCDGGRASSGGLADSTDFFSREIQRTQDAINNMFR